MKQLLIAALLTAGLGFASSTTCPTGAITAYLVPAFSCVSGDLLFDHFGYVSQNIAPNALTVQPITTDWQEGFEFIANWAGNMDSLISFKVTALAGLITDLHLSFNGLVGGTGSQASVAENYCLEGDIPTCGSPIGTPGQLAVTNPPPQFTDVEFIPGAHYINVVKDISVFANPDGGNAAISDVTNTFSHVPEPWTLALVGCGLLALGAWRRRQQ